MVMDNFSTTEMVFSVGKMSPILEGYQGTTNIPAGFQTLSALPIGSTWIVIEQASNKTNKL